MPIPTADTAARFLDPQVLSRIQNLELLARTVVDGFINGLHRSPYLGLSLDFAEHRGYMPGDDIRRIDWRRPGRSGAIGRARRSERPSAAARRHRSRRGGRRGGRRRLAGLR